MPTLAEIASVTCPPNDGISFLPTLLGNKAGQKEHEYLYWEYPDPKIGNKAIRMGKWKGIITNIRQGNTECNSMIWMQTCAKSTTWQHNIPTL